MPLSSWVCYAVSKGAVSCYLPLSPQDVLLHPLLGELLGLHCVGVLLQPGMFKTLSTGKPGPDTDSNNSP